MGLWRFGLGGGFLATPVAAQPTPATADEPVAALCEGGQCQPVISQMRYFDRTAYRLTDGKSETIVVPGIGRIMRFGRIGGPNLLWNSPTSKGIDWGWINYGGDKNWLAPQSAWPLWYGKKWPPETAFDGQPYTAEVLTGGKLRLTSPLSPGTGVRYTRTLFFNTKGELVIEQTAKKEVGAPVRAAIWNITQNVPGQAVFLIANPDSPYADKHLMLEGKQTSQFLAFPRPNLMQITPQNSGGGWKLGADSPVAGIVSVRDGVAFLQKASKPAGEYPDGAQIAGFPVEMYINGDNKVFYLETELLGPLKEFRVGTAWTHTVRWSLHTLPSPNPSAPEVAEAVEKLLNEP